MRVMAKFWGVPSFASLTRRWFVFHQVSEMSPIIDRRRKVARVFHSVQLRKRGDLRRGGGGHGARLHTVTIPPVLYMTPLCISPPLFDFSFSTDVSYCFLFFADDTDKTNTLTPKNPKSRPGPRKCLLS
jgi:hypothetical protein